MPASSYLLDSGLLKTAWDRTSTPGVVRHATPNPSLAEVEQLRTRWLCCGRQPPLLSRKAFFQDLR